MKKIIICILSLLFILLLTACDNNRPSHTPPIEWGEITSFSSHWGDFHGGHQSFRIEKIDGQYLFNASGYMGVQMFVSENQPIPVHEVEALRHVLEDIGADRWNGFSSGWCGYCTGDWNFSLTIVMDNGTEINVTVGCDSPSGYREGFPVLSAFLHDLAVRYQTAPQWGNLEYMSFSLMQHGRQVISYRIFADRDGTVYFGHDREEVDPIVLKEVHQLIIDYGIIGWWDGQLRDAPWEASAYRMSVEIRFDNDTGFHTWGYVHIYPDSTRRPRPRNIFRPQCDAANALLDYFADLERRLAEPEEPEPVITPTPRYSVTITIRTTPLDGEAYTTVVTRRLRNGTNDIWLSNITETLGGLVSVRTHDEHVRLNFHNRYLSYDPEIRVIGMTRFDIPFGETFYLETLTDVNPNVVLSFVFARE